MDTPKIYVACLASYNSGILHGKWIEATQDIDEIYKNINYMLAMSPIDNAEEWAIHDFEGFGELRLSEYEDIDTIAQYAEFITKYGELGAALLGDYTMEEAETLLEDCYQGTYDNEVDFAYSIFDACYSQVMPENLESYFDYVAFARDLFISDYFSVDLDGKTHVFSNY